MSEVSFPDRNQALLDGHCRDDGALVEKGHQMLWVAFEYEGAWRSGCAQCVHIRHMDALSAVSA